MRLQGGFLDAFKGLGDIFKTEPEKQVDPGTVQEERTFADKILGRSTVTRKAPTTPAKPAKPYAIPDRGVTLDDSDLSELKNVLYAEVSNRDPEKQKLESRVIINTALNRIGQYKEHGRDLSLGDVLREPNQYQGYNPKNEKSQYNVAKTGKGDAQKLSTIDSVLAELTAGKFDDNTGGAAYYVHHPDGRIEFDNKKPLFAPTALVPNKGDDIKLGA